MHDVISNKNKKLWKVVNTVFYYEVSRGHLAWKISDVARTSKISRTLIYYYFGNTKKKIFDSCLKSMAFYFYGHTDNDAERGLPTNASLADAVFFSKNLIDTNPYIMAFSYKWRRTESPIRDKLVEWETGFRNGLAKQNPELKPHQLLGLHAIFHGITTAPFLDEKGLRSVVDLITRIQNGQIKMK